MKKGLLLSGPFSMALSVAKKGYVLEEGRIALEGPAADLVWEEKIRQDYLGEEVTGGKPLSARICLFRKYCQSW